MADETKCDNTLVGALAKDFEGKILLIKRKKFPYGWAPPSGHCDGATYPVACFNEFEEETGLSVVGAPRPVRLYDSRKYFKCWRGGEFHDWQIFEVNWRGELKPSKDETKSVSWCSKKGIEWLATKTASYLEKVRQTKLLQHELCRPMLESVEMAWQINPGLEPVWYEFFKELKIIPGDSQ